jgi:hypothetical protein
MLRVQRYRSILFVSYQPVITITLIQGVLMRLALITCCLLALSVCGFAADDNAAPAATAKAVNTICPVSGEKVDSTIAPVEGKTKDGKTVEIGVCCEKCLPAVKKNPDQYADAAVSNKKYQETDK